MLILIRGAGDLASGVAHRLIRSGFSVILTDTAKPTTVRCTVAFSQAIYTHKPVILEGVAGELADSPEHALLLTRQGKAAILVDPECCCREKLHPDVLVDAVIAKRNLGTKITDAPVVIALGPGFTAGEDCHAIIETKRGHTLGTVILHGSAIPNTGIPGNVGGYTSQRLLRAPCSGIFSPVVSIGTIVKKGDITATVDGMPIISELDGVVRGLLPEGTPVFQGMKSGDVDPRGIRDYCFTISDKARAIGGGVLEAILLLQHKKGGNL